MKFSIVTPSYNCEEFIKESLESVFNQEGNFSIEHIVMDGGSKDSTKDLLEQFSKNIENRKCKCLGYKFKWFSQKDNGMYDAILQGLKKTDGDIMAWINTDDLYQEGAFRDIVDLFQNNTNVEWIKGVTDYIGLEGVNRKGTKRKYSQKLIQKGVYGSIGPFIQQDSVFWKRSLWDRVDYDQLLDYKMAGDFRLWQLFSADTKLYFVDKHVSFFRKSKNQKSKNISAYLNEARKTVKISKFEIMYFDIIFKVEKFLGIGIISGPSIN